MAAVNAVGRAVGLEPLELEDTRARELFERHAARVLAYCRSRLRRREDAEDAVQTTFMHAVGNLRRGDTPSHELAWLLGIARNVCLSRVETSVRRARLELVCDPVDLERNEAPDARRDELIGLEDALARLPEQQRRAVLLRDWRGLSYEEVATQLGVSLANAETLIFRGRRSLAALLDEQPAATRRRLASLGNVGSLLAWAKASVGGAAAAKLAAAAVFVAVSGAGVAAGTGALDRGRPSPPAVAPTPAPTPVPTVARSLPASPGTERSRPASAKVSQGEKARPVPAQRPENPVAKPDRPAATVPAAPNEASDRVSQGGSAAPGAAPAEPAPPAARDPRPRAALPRPAKVVPAATSAVGTTVEGVTETVTQVAPPLAPVLEPVTETVVEVVEAGVPPVLDEVVAAVPPVTVGPITVDPPKLLPRP